MAWLQMLHLDQYSDAFVAFGINGRVLQEGSLSNDEMLELGIASQLQRKKIFAEIKHLLQMYGDPQGCSTHRRRRAHLAQNARCSARRRPSPPGAPR